MKIIYRLSDRPSTNPSPIFHEDKLALNKLCLRSVVDAFRDVQPKMTFILDYCPPIYEDIIKQLVPFEYDIRQTEMGVYGTAEYQYTLVEDTDDFILFQECDYLYRENTGKQLVEACRKLGYVSPYDHPDKYPNEQSNIEIIGNLHWKNTISTTSTFMTPLELFKSDLDLFRKHGWVDHERWVDINQRGHKLWTPIPSIATHLVKDWMAPGIDWEDIWNTVLLS